MLYGISRVGLRDLESEQLVEQENNIVQRNEIKDCFSIISIKWPFFRVLKSYRADSPHDADSPSVVSIGSDLDFDARKPKVIGIAQRNSFKR